MRIHTLEATGGLTYSQMGRFTAKPGTPAKFTDGHGANERRRSTHSSTRRRSGRSTTALRNLWVTETALTTALNTSYMAEQLSLFGIVVGIALLLAGIGFGILAIGGALRSHGDGARVLRPQDEARPPQARAAPRKPPASPQPPRRAAFGRPVVVARSLLEQALVERVAHELGAARQPELLHDVGAVRLGRAHRDVELLRDLLVRVPEREQPQHLALAIRQRILPRRGAPPRSRRRRAARRAPDGRSGRRARPRGSPPRPPCRRPPSARSRSRRPRTPGARTAGRPASRARAPSSPAARAAASAATSMPLWSGMTTSIRITSGFSARAWKIASRALPASPTASRSSSRVEQEPQAGADDGVIVDDQDARRSRDRHLGDERRAGLLRSTRLEPAVEQRDALAHAHRGRSRRRDIAPGRSPGRRPRSPPRPRRPSGSATMLTFRALRVLDDVRERLLHDAVERGLDLGRQALRRRAPTRSGP